MMKKDAILNIRLTKSDHKKIRIIAVKENKTLGDIVKESLAVKYPTLFVTKSSK
jgi:hypothetical protein